MVLFRKFLNSCWHQLKSKAKDHLKNIFRFNWPYRSPYLISRYLTICRKFGLALHKIGLYWTSKTSSNWENLSYKFGLLPRLFYNYLMRSLLKKQQNLIYLIYLASLNFTLSNDSIFYNFLQPRNVIVVYSYVLYFYSTLLLFLLFCCFKFYYDRLGRHLSEPRN